MNHNKALRVGVGGPVGSGKTALLELLCKFLRDKYSIAVVTNDIYTQVCRSVCGVTPSSLAFFQADANMTVLYLFDYRLKWLYCPTRPENDTRKRDRFAIFSGRLVASRPLTIFCPYNIPASSINLTIVSTPTPSFKLLNT